MRRPESAIGVTDQRRPLQAICTRDYHYSAMRFDGWTIPMGRGTRCPGSLELALRLRGRSTLRRGPRAVGIPRVANV